MAQALHRSCAQASAKAKGRNGVGCGNEPHARNQTLGAIPESGRGEGLFGVESEDVDCSGRVRHGRFMNDHERGFLAFLVEPTRRRMETLLELGEKRRAKARSLLDHAVRLDPRYAQHLTGSDAFTAQVEAMLAKRGAPATCYVLAAGSDLDGRVMPLGEALDAIIGMGNGAFVSCIPGRLGFFEYESMQSSYLLQR